MHAFVSYHSCEATLTMFHTAGCALHFRGRLRYQQLLKRNNYDKNTREQVYCINTFQMFIWFTSSSIKLAQASDTFEPKVKE